MSPVGAGSIFSPSGRPGKGHEQLTCRSSASGSWHRRSSGGECSAVLEAVAGSVDGDDVAVVQQPVEDRGGEHVVAEDLAPFGEALVAGDDRAAAFVAAADQLEDHVRLGARERQVADLVDDKDPPAPAAAKRPGNRGGCPQGDLSASPSVASGDVSPVAADGDAVTEVLTSANMPPAWSRSADPGSGLRAKMPAPGSVKACWAPVRDG